MGLLRSSSWAAELRWSRLPWSLRVLWLVAACIALRRAWDACDDAVARSWSALLFDDGQEEVLGSGDSSAGGRLVRRCAYGACAFVHEPVLGLWERCMAASEARDITLPSVLLALVGLGMQLLVLASNMIEAYVLRREGLLALGGLVLLEHKEAAYAWCDELGLTALVGSFLPPLGPAMDWLAACFGAGDGLLLLDEVDEAELPALEDTAPPPPRNREQGHGNGNGNGLLRRRRRRGSSDGGDGGAAEVGVGRLSSPGVVTRSTSRLLKRRMSGGGAIEAEEREDEEQPLLGAGAYQNGHHHHRYGSSRSSNGSSNGRRRHQSPSPSSSAAAAAGAGTVGAASKRARPPPEGWLVYDEAAGLVPYEVAARWAASEADGNGHHGGNGHHHSVHEEGQAHAAAAGGSSKSDAGGRGGRINGGGNGAVLPRSLPPVRMFGEQGPMGRRDGHR